MNPQDNAFNEWLEQFAYLSGEETSNLPGWQRSITLVHQFALNSMGDGAGSLYYNDPGNVDNVAQALDEIGEALLAEKIRMIAQVLEPFVEDNPPNWQDILVEQCLHGAAAADVDQLDTLLNDRWDALYSKLEDRARSNGWRPSES